MDGAVLLAHGDDASADALVIHDQVERKVLHCDRKHVGSDLPTVVLEATRAKMTSYGRAACEANRKLVADLGLPFHSVIC